MRPLRREGHIGLPFATVAAFPYTRISLTRLNHSGTIRALSTLIRRVLTCGRRGKVRMPLPPSLKGKEDDRYCVDVSDTRLAGQPGSLHPGRQPFSPAHSR